MAATKSAANQFVLHGDHAAISFATTSFAGKATFDYKAGQQQLHFTGSEIRSVDTEFAKLVTVSIGEGDAGDSLVTLLVPSLSLLLPGEKVQIETVAIVTALRRLGPAHQLYRVLHLHGTAEAVVF